MLRCIVDTHHNICSPGHLELGQLGSDLYKTIYYSLGKLSNIDSSDQRDQMAIKETRAVIDNILDRYVKGKGKVRWCEKSTNNLDYLNNIERVFPDAQFVCLYRNCLDVAYSSLKFSTLGYMPELLAFVRNKPDNLVAAMIDNWLDKTKKMLEFERTHSSQCIRINYESLVFQPKLILAKLFEFLGEPWDEDLIDSIFKVSHDQGDGDVKVWFSDRISEESIGKGVEIPITSIPADLKEQIDIIHRQLGYSTIDNMYSEFSDTVGQSDTVVDLNDFFRNNLLQNGQARLDRFKSIRGTCQFAITGANGGTWIIESNSDGFAIANEDRPFDCSISTSYRVFCELIAGRKNPVHAYEQGEIKGGGNLQIAMEFGRFVFGGDF